MNASYQEAAKEHGEKYGIEIDASKKDENFQRKMDAAGRPNFNEKWNILVANNAIGRMMDINAAPPEGFSFFYELGDSMGVGNNTLIINGKGWSAKMTVPFENHSEKNRFYLSELLHVSGDKENAKWHNEFLGKLVVNRVTPNRIY